MSEPAGITRARYLLDLGRHDEARDVVRAVLLTAPEDAAALELLVEACLPLGDRAALPAAESLVRLRPDDPGPLMLAAQACAAVGRSARSRRYAGAALALEPDSADLHRIRGYLDLVGVTTADGLRSARRAVELDPDDADAHRVLGALLLKRGRLDDAEAALHRALALDPAHAAALDDLARLHLERLTPIEAARRFAAALAVDPGDERAAHNAMAALGRPVGTVHTVLVLTALWLLLDRGPTSTTLAAYVGIVAVMVTAARTARSLVRRMPDSGGRLFATTLRRDRLLVLLGVLLGAAVVVLYAVPVAPDAVLDAVVGTFSWLVLGAATAVRLLRLLLGRSRVQPMV